MAGTGRAARMLALPPMLRELPVTVALMVVLAGLGPFILPQTGFWRDLKYTLPVGIAIHILSSVLCGQQAARLNWRTSLIAIPVGTGIGILIGSLLNGIHPLQLVGEHPDTVLTMATIAFATGCGISYYFYAKAALADYASQVSDANLRLLQAQMEPHFLFNTLATVLSLIHDAPDKAEDMLEDFIAYLRASLHRSRANAVTLSEEMDLVRAYLGIQSKRMGERLVWTIDAPAELLKARLPPLLIQPLVENAVKHGLEGRAAGGRIAIRAEREGERLAITVEDNGDGLPSQYQPGIGLGHVEARLHALYGKRAGVRLAPVEGGGARASLLIPWREGDGA